MSPKHEKTIFFEALEIESPRAREAFVQGSCQGDPELLDAVSRLLAEHDRADNPIDHPVVASLPTFDAVTHRWLGRSKQITRRGRWLVRTS